MAKTLVLCDFDGTVTTKDSFLEMIKFDKGRLNFIIGMALQMPFIALYKAGFINAQTLKEKVLVYFWKQRPVNNFINVCEQFQDKILPALLRPKAMDVLKNHKQQGNEVAIVSASAEEWLMPFCNTHQLNCICTKLQKVSGKLTGKIDGLNCKGVEKVKRVKQVYDLAAYDKIIVYGDSLGDKELFEIATLASYKPFH